MRTNFHTHTQRCLHAGGTEADYVSAALRANVKVLGFSDHAPFPDADYGYRMPFGELETYLAAVDAEADAHRDEITILKGLEIEYLPRYRAYYEELLGRYGLDYLLLGEHFFPGRTEGELMNVTLGPVEPDTASFYARAVAEAMETGYFKMVAHPDIYAMSPFAWDGGCDRAADIIIDAAVRTGTILEFNANGVRRGVFPYPDGERYMYPHRRFWERAAEAGVRVIVGSDCHGPDQVWDASMERAFELLSELGITPLEVPEGLLPD